MSSPGEPVTHAAAITPADNTLLGYVSSALWVGTPGDIQVTMMDGTTVIFKSASGWMPIRCKMVWATNTTASNITAVWN